jgi:hypothetical protein
VRGLDAGEEIRKSPSPLHDLSHKCVWIFEYEPIWQPQNGVAGPRQGAVTRSISSRLARLRVNTSVQLHHEAALRAAKVRNPGSNRVLAAKLQPLCRRERSSRQAICSACVAVRRRSRALAMSRRIVARTPSPVPPRRDTLSPKGAREEITKIVGATPSPT